VAGPRPLRDYLINTARTQIFSTAISPALAAAATRGIELARRMDAERGRLLAMADNLRGQLRRLGFHVPHGRGPIVPLILGDEAAALRGQQILWDQGVWVQAIRPPSVPPGTCRLRFSLRADLAPADLALINSAVAELAARL